MRAITEAFQTKNRIRFVFFGRSGSLLSFLLISVACGPAHPVPLSPKVQSQQPSNKRAPSIEQDSRTLLTQSLNFRFIPSTNGRRNRSQLRQPDLDFNSSLFSQTNRSIRIYQNQISFERPLVLPMRNSSRGQNQQEWMFVWSDAVFGSAILQSFVSYRILDGNNHWIESSVPVSASHQSESHLWYFSIIDFVANNPVFREGFEPSANLVLLNLDLVLSNQSRVRIEVRFRIGTQE